MKAIIKNPLVLFTAVFMSLFVFVAMMDDSEHLYLKVNGEYHKLAVQSNGSVWEINKHTGSITIMWEENHQIVLGTSARVFCGPVVLMWTLASQNEVEVYRAAHRKITENSAATYLMNSRYWIPIRKTSV